MDRFCKKAHLPPRVSRVFKCFSAAGSRANTAMALGSICHPQHVLWFQKAIWRNRKAGQMPKQSHFQSRYSLKVLSSSLVPSIVPSACNCKWYPCRLYSFVTMPLSCGSEREQSRARRLRRAFQTPNAGPAPGHNNSELPVCFCFACRNCPRKKGRKTGRQDCTPACVSSKDQPGN